MNDLAKAINPASESLFDAVASICKPRTPTTADCLNAIIDVAEASAKKCGTTLEEIAHFKNPAPRPEDFGHSLKAWSTEELWAELERRAAKWPVIEGPEIYVAGLHVVATGNRYYPGENYPITPVTMSPPDPPEAEVWEVELRDDHNKPLLCSPRTEAFFLECFREKLEEKMYEEGGC